MKKRGKRKNKKKKEEKEREAYNVKLKNVPGIGKEDSPGSELGGKSIREEVRRASFGPGTFFDSKNIPGPKLALQLQLQHQNIHPQVFYLKLKE